MSLRRLFFSENEINHINVFLETKPKLKSTYQYNGETFRYSDGQWFTSILFKYAPAFILVIWIIVQKLFKLEFNSWIIEMLVTAVFILSVMIIWLKISLYLFVKEANKSKVIS